MPTFVFTDPVITVNSTAMSPMATKVTLKYEAPSVPDTAFGDLAESLVGGGIAKGTLQIDWNQDFAAGQVDALLWPLFNTVVTFDVRATSAAASATNPRFTGSVLINDYSPFDGSVGDLAKLSTTWPTSGRVLRFTT
jgi:hypothetical protein